MNTNEMGIVIAATEAQHKCGVEPNLERRIEKCMQAVQNSWMLTDEESKFRAAILAALQLSNDDEKEKIREALEPLKILSALLSGVPVDMSAVKLPENPIRLRDIWTKVTTKESGK